MNKKPPVPCGCGGEAVTDYIIGEPCEGLSWFVYCKNCEIQLPAEYSTEDEAIEAWNKSMSGSAKEKLKAFWDSMSAEMNEERTVMVESSTITINPPNSIWKCGNCGQQMYETHFGNRIKYCSNCGARLEWE